MHIPSHLNYFSSNKFQNNYKAEIKDEFSKVLQNIGLTFEDFEHKLNKLDRALFFKIGHVFCYYIKDFDCKKCFRSHQAVQLRFLSCIAVIESLLGNAKQKIRKINGKQIKEPIVVTFLTNNLLGDEKKELLRHINIQKSGKRIKSSFSTLKSLVDMRNGFMHRAELISIKSGIREHISIRRTHRGRHGGMISVTIDLERFAELVKISIIRYLLKPMYKRTPLMNHQIVR